MTLDQLPPGRIDPREQRWDGTPAALERTIRQLDEHGGGAAGSCSGFGRTATGGLISARRLAPNLCETEFAVIATDAAGAVLAYGRSKRLATRDQRLALAARDGGCSFPGCTRPPGWTEAHHITPWVEDGGTDLANLRLVCPYHHRHFERLGWAVRANRGVPEWIPPPWIDPGQRPRRNAARHLAEYDFARALSPSPRKVVVHGPTPQCGDPRRRRPRSRPALL